MKTSLKLLLILIMCIGMQNAFGQLIDVKGKVRNKAIDRADQRTDEGIDKGMDAIENGVKNAFKKKDKNESEAGQEQAEESETIEKSSKASGNKTSVKQEEPAKLTSFTKYDFIPGDQVLLFDDFSQDEVGDFPALWTTNGSGEVRTLNLFPGRWLYMNSQDNVYCLMKDLALPENFILEFDVVPTPAEEDGDVSNFYITLYQKSEGGDFLNDELYPGTKGVHITMGTDGWRVTGYREGGDGVDGSSELAPLELNKLNHVIVWAQKRRLRVYHKGQKVLDLPTILPEQSKFDRFRYSLWSQTGFPYVTNVRFTTAAPDMRSKLLTEGKIVSYGIYFDINSDKVKPESAGTLKEIAKVLSENPSVRIKIVGHTDGDGDAAKNLDLSKRRAASVKNELATSFGIDAARIETDGKGKNEPVAPNDTPANKAKNRRVEFIKL